MDKQKVTIHQVMAAKEQGRKLVMLTAYDHPFAQMVDEAGVDMVLVGDSVGMVVMGLESTVGVTMDAMVHHVQAVARGVSRALVIGDMPFMSYHTSIREAIANAGRLIKEGGADVVKLEGGRHFAPTVEALVRAGIPVQGHIGLTPQTATALGGLKAQARDAQSALELIRDAKALEAAGVFSIVLEAVPAEVGMLVAQSVKVPVIGIGAGPHVDGQVLVTHDMLGLFQRFVPRFVKQYVNVRPIILEALRSYADEVMKGAFPAPEHCFSVSEEVMEKLQKLLREEGM
jgi:3-methyl-2-oxobutanoate hydroxymethyltransferase